MKVEIDNLKYLFYKYKEKLINSEEAIKINITNIFFDFLKEKIKHKELIVINIRGEVRTGKSTLALYLMKKINEIINDNKLNNIKEKDLIKYVFSEQIEFLRFINTEQKNVCVMIDEFNRMGETGLNATTEEALYEHYSDVFAGQYIHRIYCSTDKITDKNSNVIINVLGKTMNNNRYYIIGELLYRDIITKITLTIGKIEIDITDLIDIWINKNVRSLVENKAEKDLTEKEKQVIEKYKDNFYVAYQIKKYKRMELIKKYGVRDIRDLEFAEIVLKIFDEGLKYIKAKKIDKPMCDLLTNEVIKNSKRIYSTYTELEISKRTYALLDVAYEVYNTELLIRKTRDLYKLEQYKILEKNLREMLGKRLSEQDKYAKIYEEYTNI